MADIESGGLAPAGSPSPGLAYLKANLRDYGMLMALVAINIGLDLKLLNRELFTMLVIMALVTTAMTEPLLRLFLPAEPRRGSDWKPDETL